MMLLRLTQALACLVVRSRTVLTKQASEKGKARVWVGLLLSFISISESSYKTKPGYRTAHADTVVERENRGSNLRKQKKKKTPPDNISSRHYPYESHFFWERGGAYENMAHGDDHGIGKRKEKEKAIVVAMSLERLDPCGCSLMGWVGSSFLAIGRPGPIQQVMRKAKAKAVLPGPIIRRDLLAIPYLQCTCVGLSQLCVPPPNLSTVLCQRTYTHMHKKERKGKGREGRE